MLQKYTYRLTLISNGFYTDENTTTTTGQNMSFEKGKQGQN